MWLTSDPSCYHLERSCSVEGDANLGGFTQNDRKNNEVLTLSDTHTHGHTRSCPKGVLEGWVMEGSSPFCSVAVREEETQA